MTSTSLFWSTVLHNQRLIFALFKGLVGYKSRCAFSPFTHLHGLTGWAEALPLSGFNQPAATSSAQLRAEQISLCAGSVRQQNGGGNFGGRLPGLQSWANGWRGMWIDIPDAQACFVTSLGDGCRGRCQSVGWGRSSGFHLKWTRAVRQPGHDVQSRKMGNHCYLQYLNKKKKKTCQILKLKMDNLILKCLSVMHKFEKWRTS